MTLYEYFKRGNDRNVIDHSLRCQLHGDGRISFYIHPANVDGDTVDFVLSENQPDILVEGGWQETLEIIKEEDNRDPIPKDLDEAVTVFIAGMRDKDKELVIREGDFPHGWHFLGGMRLRNSWGLWTGSVLAIWFESKGITHADDMTGIIEAAVTAKLCNEHFDLGAAIARTQFFWSKKENGGHPNGIPPAPWRQKNIEPEPRLDDRFKKV
jgi:hypothetical protein